LDTEYNVGSIKTARKKLIIDILIILGSCLFVYILASKYDILESIVAFSRQYENWEVDEIITVAVFLMFALVLFSIRRWQEITKSLTIISQQNMKLQKTLKEIKQLEGIIPICASCKKIRNDAGFWEQVEKYIGTHTEAKFSHSMCPECLDKFYGNEDWYVKRK
jgi:uncharacterized protein (DUF486 family)